MIKAGYIQSFTINRQTGSSMHKVDEIFAIGAYGTLTKMLMRPRRWLRKRL